MYCHQLKNPDWCPVINNTLVTVHPGLTTCFVDFLFFFSEMLALPLQGTKVN